MPELNIPFPGFYESWLSQEIDSQIERYVENLDQQDWPGDLRLTESDMFDPTWRAMDYGIAQDYVAREYVKYFDAWCGEVLGETRLAWRYDWQTKKRVRYQADSCGFAFSIMTSPREYNFTTDRLFVTCSAAFVKRLWRRSKADSHDTLRRLIREKFTSRDGFISHYRNDLESWGSAETWDYNQLGTLLQACLELSGADDESLFYDMLESELFYHAFDKAFDFARYESDNLEKRAELLHDWLVADPESCSQWRAQNPDKCAQLVAADPSLEWPNEWPEVQSVGAWYRCDKTSDMFEGV